MLFSSDPSFVERAIRILQDEDWSTAVSTMGGIVGLISLLVGLPIAWVKAAAARRSAAEAKDDREGAVTARDAALKAADDAARAQKRIAEAMERLNARDWQLTRLSNQEYELENVSGQHLYNVVIAWTRQRTAPLTFNVVHKGASKAVHIPYANSGPKEIQVAWSDSPDAEKTSQTTLAVRWQ